MNKKGVDLSLNTIIIAIIVVVVLVVVVSFFLFGFQGLTSTAKKIFFGTTAGTDMTLAVQNCRYYCEQAEIYPTDTLKRASSYCHAFFNLDTNNNGEAELEEPGNADSGYKKFYCDEEPLNVPCDVKLSNDVSLGRSCERAEGVMG